MQNNKKKKSLANVLLDQNVRPHFPVGFYLSIGKKSIKPYMRKIKMSYYNANLRDTFDFYKPISKI